MMKRHPIWGKSTGPIIIDDMVEEPKPLTKMEFDRRTKEYFSKKQKPIYSFVHEPEYKRLCDQFGEQALVDAGFRKYERI